MMTIKEIRKEKGLTQAALAEQIGVSRTVLANWETESSFPRASLIPAIADALGCSIDALYGRKAPRSTAATDSLALELEQ